MTVDPKLPKEKRSQFSDTARMPSKSNPPSGGSVGASLEANAPGPRAESCSTPLPVTDGEVPRLLVTEMPMNPEFLRLATKSEIALGYGAVVLPERDPNTSDSQLSVRPQDSSVPHLHIQMMPMIMLPRAQQARPSDEVQIVTEPLGSMGTAPATGQPTVARKPMAPPHEPEFPPSSARAKVPPPKPVPRSVSALPVEAPRASVAVARERAPALAPSESSQTVASKGSKASEPLPELTTPLASATAPATTATAPTVGNSPTIGSAPTTAHAQTPGDWFRQQKAANAAAAARPSKKKMVQRDWRILVGSGLLVLAVLAVFLAFVRAIRLPSSAPEGGDSPPGTDSVPLGLDVGEPGQGTGLPEPSTANEPGRVVPSSIQGAQAEPSGSVGPGVEPGPDDPRPAPAVQPSSSAQPAGQASSSPPQKRHWPRPRIEKVQPKAPENNRETDSHAETMYGH